MVEAGDNGADIEQRLICAEELAKFRRVLNGELEPHVFVGPGRQEVYTAYTRPWEEPDDLDRALVRNLAIRMGIEPMYVTESVLGMNHQTIVQRIEELEGVING